MCCVGGYGSAGLICRHRMVDSSRLFVIQCQSFRNETTRKCPSETNLFLASVYRLVQPGTWTYAVYNGVEGKIRAAETSFSNLMENLMDRSAWWAKVHRVAKRRTWPCMHADQPRAWLEARSFLACRAPVMAFTKGHPNFEGSSWSSAYLVHPMTSCCLMWTLAVDVKYVQFSSVAQSCPTLCDPKDHTRQASLSITNSPSLLKLISIELVMPSNHLILCCPHLLLPQSFPASGSFQMSQLFVSGGQSIWVSASTCSGCCNVPPKLPFTNKWFFSLVAGNASGFLWILPWPGEFPYPKAIHPFWGSKHPMSAQCKKSHGFFCRMGNSEGLNYELAVGSAEAWLFSLPNPISFPSHPQT